MTRTHHSIRRMIALAAMAALVTTGASTAVAHAQPEPSRGVWIDYAKLDALGIDHTGVELAVNALVR